MKLETLTFADVLLALAVLVLAIATYNTIMSGVKNMREEKKRRDAPVDTLSQKVMENSKKISDHDQMLKNDKERLDDTDKQLRILMRSMMAMLSHEISGNSVDKLRDSMNEINDYLVNR